MKNKEILLVYIIPMSILALVFYFLIQVDFEDETQTKKIQLSILNESKENNMLIYNDDYNSFNFYVGYLYDQISFNNIKLSKQIAYGNHLISQCKENKLTPFEAKIIEPTKEVILDEKMLLDFSPIINKKAFNEGLGFFSIIGFIVIAFILINRIKKKNLKNIFKYYLIFFILTSYLINADNKIELESFEKNTHLCYKL